jgi:hypothetical protein
VWVFPATYLPRALFRGMRKNDPYPPWQVPAVISWTGMRGVVTLAAAFVIPPTVPERETLVFLAFFVTVATLLLHGLTLPMVIRLLGVRETTSITDVLAEAQAQQAAARAGIARLDELTADESEDSPAGHAAMKLRQARVGIDARYRDILRARVSVDFADLLGNPRPGRVLRNAWGNIAIHPAFQIKVGQFKRPYSRLELRSSATIPFMGRGLFNDLAIEDLQWGSRAVGLSLWGKIETERKVGKAKINLLRLA